MSKKCKGDIEYNLVYSLVLRPLDRTRELEQQEIINTLMAGEDSNSVLFKVSIVKI